jgi:hypothetical protein
LCLEGTAGVEGDHDTVLASGTDNIKNIKNIAVFFHPI